MPSVPTRIQPGWTTAGKRSAANASQVEPQVGSLRGWLSLSRFSWYFPLLIAAALLLSLMLWPGRPAEPPLLLPVLNLLFLFAIPLLAALLAGRSYAAGGSVPLLLMGCGAAAFSYAGLLAGWYHRAAEGPDLAAAIYSLSALVAGLCSFAAAGLVLGGFAREQAPPLRLRTYVLACAGAIALLGFLTLARIADILPAFFVEGRPTTLRQAVLGLAMLTFLVSAIVNWFIHLRSGAAFFRWQGLALGTIGLGLGVFYVIPDASGPAIWIGRTLQYLGFVYLLAAIGATAAEMSARGVRAGTGIAALFRAAGIDYRSLVEVAGAPIVLLDGNGLLQYANAAAERLLGGAGAAILGRPLREMVLLEEDDQDDEPLSFLGAAEPSESERLHELTLQRLDGSVFPAEVAVLARPGGGAGAVLLLRDVTERKLADDALRRHARELRALAVQLTDTEQRERRRLARQLHDGLQQLMVAAKLGLGPLEMREQDARQREGIRRVIGLLDQALTASRALTLEISPPVLYENGLPMALEWLAGRFGEKYGLEIDVRIDPDADPGSDSLRAQLFHAARELLFNVVKHAGVVEASLSLDQSDGWLVLRVADEGAGFTFDEVRTGGGGFGLFGMRERLEALGGTVRIDTDPGQGTRIELLVPLDGDAEERIVTPIRPVDQARRPARRRGDPREPGCLRVLIVDDHAVVRSGLAILLQEHADIEVVGQVADGDEALVAVARWHPDIVIMDVSMARMSGIEATRRLLDKRPTLRVIGLSMHDDGFIRAAMESAGAVACLPKGGSVDDLIATIRRAPGEDEDPPPVIA